MTSRITLYHLKSTSISNVSLAMIDSIDVSKFFISYFVFFFISLIAYKIAFYYQKKEQKKKVVSMPNVLNTVALLIN